MTEGPAFHHPPTGECGGRLVFSTDLFGCAVETCPKCGYSGLVPTRAPTEADNNGKRKKGQGRHHTRNNRWNS